MACDVEEVCHVEQRALSSHCCRRFDPFRMTQLLVSGLHSLDLDREVWNVQMLGVPAHQARKSAGMTLQ